MTTGQLPSYPRKLRRSLPVALAAAGSGGDVFVCEPEEVRVICMVSPAETSLSQLFSCLSPACLGKSSGVLKYQVAANKSVSRTGNLVVGCRFPD